MHEAKTHLSKLVERVENGEEIVIARAGKPVARLAPVEAPKVARKGGWAKGQIWMSDDFFGVQDVEIEKMFGTYVDPEQ